MVNVGFVYVEVLLAVDWRARRRLLQEKQNKWNPAGAHATRRLIGRPRKAKPWTEINSGETNSPDHLLLLFVFKWGRVRYVSTSYVWRKKWLFL